jgi:hypothetical protein
MRVLPSAMFELMMRTYSLAAGGHDRLRGVRAADTIAPLPAPPDRVRRQGTAQ